MVTGISNRTKLSNSRQSRWRRFLPILLWLPNYRKSDLGGDLLAGSIVAVMLIPQGMAYALLAGLPPQVGLYASISPLIIYGLFGTSRALSVGPTAVTSLLVAAGLAQLGAVGADGNEVNYIQAALSLALLVGLIRLGLGLLRFGAVVNFMSQTVLSGFINAAALVILISQLKHLLGVSVPSFEYTHETLLYTLIHLTDANFITVLIALLSIGLLLYFKRLAPQHLSRLPLNPNLRLSLLKTGALAVLLIATGFVYIFGLDQSAGVAIVGHVPSGLPPLTNPLELDFELWWRLLPTALTISLIGFVESISVAKSLASQRREKIDPDQELVALGLANIGAAFSGGYPITGGLSRSVVNAAAGANTGMASIITALFIALTLIFLTPLFYYLPQAALAAIILMAVLSLLDFKLLRRAWRYSYADTAAFMMTFGGVFILGVEGGVLLGVLIALGLHLWRSSQPHIAVVGCIEGSEHFRNVLRHDVQTWPHILAIRVDESLYFANTQYLESYLLAAIADQPQVQHVVLVCSAVNYIDLSALETLEQLIEDLRVAGVTLYLSDVKGPVMDRLQSSGFIDKLGAERVFLSIYAATSALSSCA